MNKEKRKKLFGLFFLLLFLTSINLSLLTLPVFATTQGENLSVEYGDNVFQYIPYTYAGTFYDDADYKFAYSDVDIEFTYIPDPTVNAEYPVTDSLTNSESLQAFGEQNFTFNEGSGADYENMMSEDSVYTNFNYTGVGHYNATYSFENDLDGTSGSDIGFIDSAAISSSCSATIVGNKNDHKKILDLYDNNNAGKVVVSNNFNNQATGTVEVWIQSDDVSVADCFMYIDDDDTDHYRKSLGIRIVASNIQYYDGGLASWQTALGINDNVWYHIWIDFSEPSNTYDLYINGISEASGIQFRDNPEQLNRITFATDITESLYHYYIDAIDYSWDSDYVEGRNREDLDPIGHYPGSYSFDDQPVWTADIAIDFVDGIIGHTNSYGKIVASWEDHKKVIECYSGGVGDRYRIYNIISAQASGDIEFWIGSPDTTNYHSLYFTKTTSFAGSNIATLIYIENDNIYCSHGNGIGGTTYTDIGNILDDEWVHIKLHFDTTTDTIDVYVNENKQIDGENFFGDNIFGASDLNTITLYGPNLQATGCFDAISYSWEDLIGDNINDNYLLGTETFEEENVGTSDTSISWVDWSSGDIIDIVAEFNSHKKILRLYDNNGAGVTDVYNTDTSQGYGTIEFWMKTSDATKRSDFRLRSTVGNELFRFFIDQDTFWVYEDVANLDTGVTALDDTWYHIGLDFECTTGGYQGLSQYEFHIYINNDLYGDYEFTNDEVDFLQVRLVSDWTDNDYYTYYNSISFSWDEPETSYFKGSYNQHCNIEAVIDFTVDIPFENYDKENLYVNITSVHFTNTYTNVSFNFYNHTSNAWQELYNTANTNPTKNEIIFSSADLNGFFGSSGIQLKYYAYNRSDFWFKADLINVSIWFKTELNYEHTLNLLGTWKYRFKIDVGFGSEYVQDWVYFNLIEQKENFEGVSESPYTTKWQLTSSSMSSNYEQKYQDLMGTNYWSLTGTSNPVIYYSENPEDAYVDNYYTTSNYGSTTTLGTYYEDTDYGYQYVLPNTNSGPNDWHSEYSASNHWMAVDEYTSLDGHENWADGTDDGQIEEYGMSTFTMAIGSGVGTITSVTARFYTSSNAAFEDDYSGDIRIYLGGWLSSKIMVFDILFGGSWYEQTWSGLSASQADLDGMLVECTAPGVIDPTDVHRLWSVYVKVYYSLSSTRTRETYIKSPISYLLDNVTANSKLTTYISSGTYPTTINPYETSDFTESTITNTNKPASIGSALGSTVVSSSSSPKDIDLGSIPLNYYVLKVSSTASDNGFVIYSSEYGTTGYRPLVKHYISKVYQDLSSKYVYMQANESESLGLKCQAFGTDVSLSSDNSDFFGLYLQSNTQDVYLKLYNDGDLQDTITVLENNVVTTVQYVEVSVDSDVSFDQVEIYSLLNDEEYVKLFNITAEGYTFDAQEQTTTFYVDPDGSKEVVIPTIGDADLKVYDNGILRHEETISLTTELTTVIYVREVESIININYFDSNGDYLYFNDFKTYVNYTLDEVEYNDKRLASNFLYVDSGSNVEITVYDSFDYPIISNSYPEQKFLDLELDVYELKIKNERLNPVSYSLENDDINTTKTGSLFENEILTLKIASGEYNFNYLESGESEWKEFSFALINNQYFVLNRSQICFLSYTNQRGEYLNFNQFKTYWNGTLLYENVFYEDIGNNVSIEIKDHYDISVQNHSFIVSSGDNYIPVVLTMYSLKVMSQQLCFNHINITRDPNYYDSDYFWSEWIAPSEIIEFELFAGYYKINLTNNEAGSSNLYSYTLNGDDILLISSDNTIYNVLLNIANVNTTIGNQITNVQIDLTNQNSNINNSIINIDINLGTINSTLGNMLVNLDVDITNIANNISNLYTFTENSFVNLGNNINASFICIENNIISINQSISNLVIGVSNNILLVNGTISTMISSLETNLLLMNVSIDTALFDLDTTVVEIGNNITNNYILLNNSITLGNNNINDSRIAIINNLALINNTMSNLISTVYSSVYMINNSIYTAVVDVGTSLMLINNSISGNLSIILEMNDALTELYRKTMFSSLLNWTNIGYNTSLITSQIDAWDFINHYKNQSIEIHLRYQDIVDKLVVTANNYKTQYLPAYDTDYNLWSVKDQKYLDTWEPLPDNRTVPFGFYEADIPTDPEPIINTFWTYLIVVVFFAGLSFGMLKLYYGTKERKNEVPAELVNLTSKPHKKKQKGVVDNRL